MYRDAKLIIKVNQLQSPKHKLFKNMPSAKILTNNSINFPPHHNTHASQNEQINVSNKKTNYILTSLDPNKEKNQLKDKNCEVHPHQISDNFVSCSKNKISNQKKIVQQQNQEDQLDKKCIKSSEETSKQFSCHAKKEQNSHQLYCLKNIISKIKKYFEKEKVRWNFEYLKYKHILILLKVVNYIKFDQEEHFIERKNGEILPQNCDLKRCYLLWINITQNRAFTLKNFIKVVCVIESLEINEKKLDESVQEIQRLTESFEKQNYIEKGLDPKYIFFLKKQTFTFEKNNLKFTNEEEENLRKCFKNFKLNQLTEEKVKTQAFYCQEINQKSFLSKNSVELAEKKRKKISQTIKQQEPWIQNINLYDFLNYKQHLTNSNNNKSEQKYQKVYKSYQNLQDFIKNISSPKANHIEKRVDQIQFEKDKNQYTFHPKIGSIKSLPDTQLKSIKNAQKMFNRIQKGRKIKEEKQNMLKKGWTNKARSSKSSLSAYNTIQNENKFSKKQENGDQIQRKNMNKYKITKSQEMQEKQSVLKSNEKKSDDDLKIQNDDLMIQNDDNIKNEKIFVPDIVKMDEKLRQKSKIRQYLDIPILYVDVNLEEGKKQRIIIYEGDKSKDLANSFGLKHGLGRETMERLEMMLEQQIGSILVKIDEETQEDCSFIS